MHKEYSKGMTKSYISKLLNNDLETGVKMLIIDSKGEQLGLPNVTSQEIEHIERHLRVCD